MRVSGLLALFKELRRLDPHVTLALAAVVLALAVEPARSSVTLARRVGLPYFTVSKYVTAYTFRWSRARGAVLEPRGGLPLFVRTGPAGSTGRTIRLSATAWNLLEACGVAQRPADADQEPDGLPAEAAA